MFREIKQRIFNNTKTRRTFYVILLIVLWCIIVLPVILTRNNNAPSDYGTYLPYGSTKDSFEGLIFHINFQSVDSSLRKANLYSHIYISDKYSNEFGALKDTNITCNLIYSKPLLVKDKLPDPFTFSIPFVDGNVEDYPFEEFLAFFTVYCEDNNKNVIPIAISTQKDIISYVPEIYAKPINELGELQNYFRGLYAKTDTLSVSIKLKQPITTKLFSIFVMLVMWGLSVSLFIVTYDILIHRREIPPPLLAIGVSMLFALPALRNSQPGIPIIGCLSDIFAFFWCMALIAFCSMINIFAFALRWRKPIIIDKHQVN